MDTVRDLGRTEPWQDSLERSLARRSKPSGSVKRDERTPKHRGAEQGASRRPERPEALRREPQRGASRRPAPRHAPCRPAPGRARTPKRRVTRSRILLRRAAAVLTLSVSCMTVLGVAGGRGAHPSPIALPPQALPAQLRLQYAHAAGAGPLSRWPFLRVTGAAPAHACQPVSGPSIYVNPLGGARVKPERIDQGVDYAGSGPLAAIGAARVTYLATTNTGWPGAFIEYRLLNGPDAGCYVYYAEGVNPAARLRVGATVAAGQSIASIISGWPTGIELGWGAGISTATYAARAHQWSATSDQDSVPTAAGRSFSALIAALGGPAGKVEGSGD